MSMHDDLCITASSLSIHYDSGEKVSGPLRNTFSQRRMLKSLMLMNYSAQWCLDIEGLTICDHRAFLEHISFISHHTMHR